MNEQLDLFTIDLDDFLKVTLVELEAQGIDPKEFAIRFWARHIYERLKLFSANDQVRVITQTLDFLKLEGE